MDKGVRRKAVAAGRRLARASMLAAAVLAESCSAASIQPAPQGPLPSAAEATAVESTEEYQRASFLVGDGSVPFVGMVRYFGTESLDTTMVFVALSIPPRSLSFVRAGDRYAAYYAVKIDVLSGDALVRSDRPTGEVRVASFQETNRGDEGVIFQRALRIAPGSYSIRVTAQDSLGAGSGTVTGPITVPFMADGVLSPLLPIFAAEQRQSRAAPVTVVSNPRATARYGRDSTLSFYLEGYGSTAPDTIVVISRPDGEPNTVLRRDTVLLPRNREPRAARVSVPVARLGLGPVRVTATRTNGVALGSAVVMVDIGEAAPVRTFDELLDALRYFAGEADLRVLRDATPEKRQALWSALMRQTDPSPGTPENEALHEYLRRVRVANDLYRDDARPAWTTDRGIVMIALGEPDAISEAAPSDSAGPSHSTTWDYRRLRLALVFSDQAGFGRWRLAPASDAEFRSVLAISGPCIGCR